MGYVVIKGGTGGDGETMDPFTLLLSNQQQRVIFASCCCPFVGMIFGRPASGGTMNLFLLSSLVEYCCCGTATVAADVTITQVEADLGHTMMLNDPKNNSNPAVFVGIFFREHLLARNKKNCFLLLSPWVEYFFAPAWNGLVLWFTITAFCGAVVWYSFELKETELIRT